MNFEPLELQEHVGGTLTRMYGGTLTEIADPWGNDPKIPGEAVPLKDSRK